LLRRDVSEVGRTVNTPVAIDRFEIAKHVADRLQANLDPMRAAFSTPGRIATCYVDDVLPEPIVKKIFAAFPQSGRMTFKTSIKERKYVAAQMDLYDPILEEAVYAFQQPGIVELLGQITGLDQIEPDSNLYAGGISAMQKGGYLKPHLDNSHDNEKLRFRVLNLLYYVTPDWQEADGGALQLWDDGPGASFREIHSRFNRLVVMITNRSSWHAVSPVRGEGRRCCVSNYYFSPKSPDGQAYFHATSFRGAPGERVADALMRADNAVRTTVLKTFGEKLYKNPHVYNRPKANQTNDEPRTTKDDRPGSKV
jgi:Rps23 Pro-64 3,4-dihydroxylase Tpa1-like proline 4-hydroxylase